MNYNFSKTVMGEYCSVMHKREGMINIWLVFGILEIVVSFICVTCILYVGLMGILNSQLKYNFS
jgi:hypothetical protein